MDLLSDIWGIVKNVTGIAYTWMTGYGSEKNQKARIESEDNAKLDTYHNSLKGRKIADIRRDLSGE